MQTLLYCLFSLGISSEIKDLDLPKETIATDIRKGQLQPSPQLDKEKLHGKHLLKYILMLPSFRYLQVDNYLRLHTCMYRTFAFVYNRLFSEITYYFSVTVMF